MFEYNDGTGESNILQNQFTAYLLIAIRNSKVQYLRHKDKQRQYEISLEFQESYKELQIESDMLLALPLIERLENTQLQQALRQQKKRDLYIFFSKVLEDRSFVEIAKELGMGYKAVTAIYYRMVEKIKKELGGENK